MTTERYYLDSQLTPAEARHRWQGTPTPGGVIAQEAPDWEGDGYYQVAIRRHDRPGWVFRFHLLGALTYAILNRLNDGVTT